VKLWGENKQKKNSSVTYSYTGPRTSTGINGRILSKLILDKGHKQGILIQLAKNRIKHGTLRVPRKEKNYWSSRNFFHTHYKTASFEYYSYSYSSRKHTLHFTDVFFFSIPTKTNKNCIILKLYLQTKHQKRIQCQYHVRPANHGTNKQYLGAMAQSQNALISFAMSVRPPSIIPAPQWTDFRDV